MSAPIASDAMTHTVTMVLHLRVIVEIFRCVILASGLAIECTKRFESLHELASIDIVVQVNLLIFALICRSSWLSRMPSWFDFSSNQTN